VVFQNKQILETLHHKNQSYLTSEKQVQKKTPWEINISKLLFFWTTYEGFELITEQYGLQLHQSDLFI
jgi:hypothetical protein